MFELCQLMHDKDLPEANDCFWPNAVLHDHHGAVQPGPRCTHAPFNEVPPQLLYAGGGAEGYIDSHVEVVRGHYDADEILIVSTNARSAEGILWLPG